MWWHFHTVSIIWNQIRANICMYACMCVNSLVVLLMSQWNATHLSVQMSLSIVGQLFSKPVIFYVKYWFYHTFIPIISRFSFTIQLPFSRYGTANFHFNAFVEHSLIYLLRQFSMYTVCLLHSWNRNCNL